VGEFLLVPAYPGCPGSTAVKRLCVCVRVRVRVRVRVLIVVVMLNLKLNSRTVRGI